MKYKGSAVAEMGDRGHNRNGRKEGAAVPLLRTAGTTSNTMWLRAEVYFRTKGRVHPSSHLAPIDIGQKLGGWHAFFLEAAGSPSNTKSPEQRPTSIPSGILVYPAVWPQRTLAENWGLCPFRGEELCPHLTQCRVGRRLPPYQAAL